MSPISTYSTIFFTTLLTLTSATPLSAPGHDFPFVPAPGPIPFSNIHAGDDWPRGTTIRWTEGFPTSLLSTDDFAKCLTEYGSGRFYDSWDGNICGGLGWYKGGAGDKISTYHCYQTCAPWLLYDGALRDNGEYMCEVRKGLKGHCWMGYNRLPENNGTATIA
ncbi:MAG: hypothetical protein Q9184_006943 [Pyrenodesmia sp. 2 TL-2023]